MDSGNDRVQKFDSEGKFILKWGTKGTSDGQFDTPGGIAIDSSGFIFLSDIVNNRVQKFTADGQFVTKWGSSGIGDGQFNGPMGLTVKMLLKYRLRSRHLVTSGLPGFAPSNQTMANP